MSKSLVNISIDDVTPHPLSNIEGIKPALRYVLKKFPEAKFTLFVPVAYWRTIGETATSEPLKIDQFPRFCDVLKELDPKNFEVGYHGYYHGIPGQSNNDEVAYLNYENAFQVIDDMITVVHKAGLFDVFKSILRPPAWRMSSETFDACHAHGIKTLALSPDDYAKAFYKGKDEEWDNVIYFNVNPPFKPLQLFPKTEVVYHACQWDKNYFDMAKAEELVEFLSTQEFQFSFIEELI